MNILMILFLSFSLAGGKLPACENHSTKCLMECFEKLEKTYSIQKCRKNLQKLTDHRAVLKMFDEITADYVEFSKEQIELLLKGIMFASTKHQGQFRKDEVKTPYILHPMGVARSLFKEGNVRDIDVLLAAFLHETLEDTDTTIQELETFFGSKVSNIVAELTNDPPLMTEENKERQIEHVSLMSPEARLVKLADRLYNIRDMKTPPKTWDKDKILSYLEWDIKLKNALAGTNSELETALQKEIRCQLSRLLT